MIIMYDFQAEDYEYEVSYEELRKASIEIFAKNYEIPVEKVKEVFADDWINIDQIEENFQDELYRYFESKAYKEYIDRRYA